MPVPQFVNGPGGSWVAFSTLAYNAKFQFGGVVFSKKDDARAFNLANGALVDVLPEQSVLPASVSWSTTEFTIADDVQLGDIWTDINGARWVRVAGGAINALTGLFQDDGTFAPFKSHAKVTTPIVDE